ncbi:MAG TPA: hypothetical protein VFD08_04600 [Clostridia bacterium]|nr:hypothetical protein [Clostridia bacterium]
MKKIISTFLLLLLMLGSCASGPAEPQKPDLDQTSPEKTLESFFTAANFMDMEEMIRLINPSKIQAIEEAKDFFAELEGDNYPPSMKDYFHKAAGLITYEILDSQKKEDKAQIHIESHYVESKPLLTNIIKELFSRVLKSAFTGAEIDEEAMIEKVSRDMIPKILEADKVETFTVNLEKYKEDWYFDGLSDEIKDVLTAGFFSLESDEVF